MSRLRADDRIDVRCKDEILRTLDKQGRLQGGLSFPRHRGSLPAGRPSPVATLNLQCDEFVRIKSYEEILLTLDKDNKNRGMAFDGEMMPFLSPHVPCSEPGGEICRREDRNDEDFENPCGGATRRLLPCALQRSPHVMSTHHFFVVARNLSGTRLR